VEAATMSNASEAAEDHASVPEEKKVLMPSQDVTCSSRLAYSPGHAQLARLCCRLLRCRSHRP
jgi:hypothetical protein